MEVNKLLDYFEAEDLPEEYGGTCHCENGCLPQVPKHMVTNFRQFSIMVFCLMLNNRSSKCYYFKPRKQFFCVQ